MLWVSLRTLLSQKCIPSSLAYCTNLFINYLLNLYIQIRLNKIFSFFYNILYDFYKNNVLTLDPTQLVQVFPITSLVILAPTLVTNSLECSMTAAATITAAVSLATLTGRYYEFRYQIFGVYIFFTLSTYLMVSTTSIVTLFITYEFFLIPSAALVWFFSPNKRGVKTTMFFILWTQFGSVLVLLSTVNIVLFHNVFSFNDINGVRHIDFFYQAILIVGFLIKIPVFPFYFWLTKTHVESVTSFSIFLSGFLVKIAIFGLYKYMVFFSEHILNFAASAALCSSVVASVLFIHQVDLKKAIAYATIQEMSQLLVCLIFFYSNCIEMVSFFLVTHTLLSAKYFLLNDIIYRSYNTRSILAISGLGTIAPKLSMIIAASLSLFRGLPFTVKNSVEMTMLSNFLSISGLLTISWLALAVTIGNIFFSYIFLKSIAFVPQNSMSFFDIDWGSTTVLALITYLIIFWQQIRL